MAVWRIPAVALVLAVAAGSAAAQNHTLAEPVKAGDCFRYQIDMSLAGEMRFQQDGKATTRKLAATASHQFPERVLAAASTGLAEKTARRYETAKAVITLGNDKTERTLRAERRLIVAQRHKDDFVVYCPGGPLTREELELVAEHFDTLALTGLLPGKAAAVGDTWKIPNAVAQALCNFEGLTEQSLTGKLEEVQGDTARLSVTGTASGIEQGALAKLTIKATCRFDLKAKRLTAVEWSQTDERDQGPASPAAATQITVTLKRTAIEEPSSLSDVALVSVPQGLEKPPQSMTDLSYADPKDRFVLVHGREWQLVGQTEEHTVLRLMERGDFVAQVTITPWDKAEKGKHLTPEQFKEAMAKTPGWEVEKEVQAGEVPADGGKWAYRLSALGKLDDVPVMQNFYLIAGPNGDQVVLVFTMAPKQADRLGSRDLALAGSIEFAPAGGGEKPKQP